MRYKSYFKRDAIKNYFPLPNEIFMLGLSSGAIAVYAYLLYVEDRKSYQCYPGYKTIGKAVRMSQNTVRKYVLELESKNLIFTEPTNIITKDGRKQNGSLLYTIRPIQEAIDLFYELQLQQMALALDDAKNHRLNQPFEASCTSFHEIEGVDSLKQNSSEIEPVSEKATSKTEKAG